MSGLLAPPLRVRRAPLLEPPFDDEQPAGPDHAVPQPVLPADWTSRGRPVHPTRAPQRSPEPRRPGQSKPGQPPVPTQAPAPDRPAATAAPDPAQPTPAQPTPTQPTQTRRALGPGPAATVRFLNACLEVVGGYRPVAHLRQLIAPAAFVLVAEQIDVARVRVLDTSAPGPARRSASPARVQVRRLRLCEPTSGVVEAAVVLGHQEQRWAFALRLENQPTGWRCTAAQTI